MPKGDFNRAWAEHKRTTGQSITIKEFAVIYNQRNRIKDLEVQQSKEEPQAQETTSS